MPNFSNPIKHFFNSPWAIGVVVSLVACLAYLLYTANPILGQPFLSRINMPYGTIFIWLLLILFPFLAYLFILQTAPMLSQLWQIIIGRLVRLALFMGFFWGIIGYYLAENWSFSFSPALAQQDERANAFWLVTGAIPILTLVALLTTAIGIGVFIVKQKKSKKP